MKRILSILLVGLLVLSSTMVFACPVFKGGEKILKSPLNIVQSVREETPKAKFAPFGLVGGFLKGVAYMGKDLVSGLYDIVASPFTMCKKSCCNI